MLEIKNLCYRYQSRNTFTLRNINLHLADGEMLLLAGRSGCGKSTLIKAISGLLGSDGFGEIKGQIFLNGEDVTHWAADQIGCLVGTVYQSPDDQLFAMTAADEVGFALENQGKAPEFIRQQVRETMALVGLAGFEDYSIHKLSGGQRQRLALASILITKPRLLILDEPVSQMNPQGVQSFLQLLVRLNKQEGIAILMIEHRVNELCKFFSRLAVMREGEIIYDGSMANAWYILTDKQDVGVREPQSIKLCRALALPRLTIDSIDVVGMIKEKCVLLSKIKKEHPAQQKKAPLLKVEHVSFTYPTNTKATLKDISFEVHQGEIVGLMGFNGAGKSTLMNLLGGLTSTENGKIFLDTLNIKEALGKIGYLRQEADLMLLADTVREELCWQNSVITADELKLLLKKLNLESYQEDFPLALSKGQRLRVVLGAMLAKKPALLLLDEPTTGQDEQSLSEIKQLLLDYKNAGGSVLICTHDVELAAEVTERVIVLRQGKVLIDQATNFVLSNEALLKAGGLTPSPLLPICSQLNIPPCVTVKEVQRYVHATAMGGR